MTYQLRDYQSDLLDRIFSQWQTNRRILAQLPTGGDKSVTFGAIYRWQEQQRGMAT
jgi:superfamily II DNA or RNA helicase